MLPVGATATRHYHHLINFQLATQVLYVDYGNLAVVNVRDLRQMEKEFSALSFQVTVSCLFNLLYVSAAVYCYVFNGTHQCYVTRFGIA